MKDYYDLHSKFEASLLFCVFEIFRKGFINSFGLSPPHYLSTPSYSWCAVLT